MTFLAFKLSNAVFIMLMNVNILEIQLTNKYTKQRIWGTPNNTLRKAYNTTLLTKSEYILDVSNTDHISSHRWGYIYPIQGTLRLMEICLPKIYPHLRVTCIR